MTDCGEPKARVDWIALIAHGTKHASVEAGHFSSCP